MKHRPKVRRACKNGNVERGQKIIIEIRAYSTLRDYLPHSVIHGDGNKWSIPEGTTVSQVLQLLGIPAEEYPVVVVNGGHGAREAVLKEGDRLDLYPLLAGG